MKSACQLSRRQFLELSAAAATASAAAAGGFARAATAVPGRLIGSQLYGWGQYYQREGRNAYENLDEVFSALRDAGYDYAEGNLDTNQPENNGGFAERLRKKGLKPVSLYTGGRLHDEMGEQVVEKILGAARVCREAGFRVINCNPDPIGRDKTDEELVRQVGALKLLGGGLK